MIFFINGDVGVFFIQRTSLVVERDKRLIFSHNDTALLGVSKAFGKNIHIYLKVDYPADVLVVLHRLFSVDNASACCDDGLLCFNLRIYFVLDIDKSFDSERDEIIKAGIDSLTVTVNAVDPQIEAQLNDYIIWHGKKIEGVEGAKILIENQLAGIRKIATAGITIKVNTVLVPRINGSHIAEIAKTVAAAGAKKYNIIPLIPTAKLADEPAPTCQEIHAARAAAMPHIELFLHCNHCRADAVGVPGRTEFSKALYANFGTNGIKENFSHG